MKSSDEKKWYLLCHRMDMYIYISAPPTFLYFAGVRASYCPHMIQFQFANDKYYEFHVTLLDPNENARESLEILKATLSNIKV